MDHHRTPETLVPRNTSQAVAAFSLRDSEPDTDPASAFWSSAPAIIASHDTHGNSVPGHETEIRSLWTPANLYFLFICPYLELNLKPEPDTLKETNQLWNWDVAEVFIGSDFANIRRYKEFELSPQGEWVDLDIDLSRPDPEEGWMWKSGCQVAARIDTSTRSWYGFMRIPYSAVDSRPATEGNLLRINFFRGQGPEPHRKEIAWRPAYSLTFHVPESFGTLQLMKN